MINYKTSNVKLVNILANYYTCSSCLFKRTLFIMFFKYVLLFSAYIFLFFTFSHVLKLFIKFGLWITLICQDICNFIVEDEIDHLPVNNPYFQILTSKIMPTSRSAWMLPSFCYNYTFILAIISTLHL